MRNPRGARTAKQMSRAHCKSLLHSSGALVTPSHSHGSSYQWAYTCQ